MRFGRAFLRAPVRLIGLVSICCLAWPLRADLWSAGYYPGWEQSSMPATSIDFAALTHVIHFSVVPNSNGTLDSSINVLSAANSADIVSHAHSASKKVLVCVGGAASQAGFQGATS